MICKSFEYEGYGDLKFKVRMSLEGNVTNLYPIEHMLRLNNYRNELLVEKNIFDQISFLKQLENNIFDMFYELEKMIDNILVMYMRNKLINIVDYYKLYISNPLNVNYNNDFIQLLVDELE